MSGVAATGSAPPTVNVISTLQQKIGPIDEIRETDANGDGSTKKISKAQKRDAHI